MKFKFSQFRFKFINYRRLKLSYYLKQITMKNFTNQLLGLVLAISMLISGGCSSARKTAESKKELLHL